MITLTGHRTKKNKTKQNKKTLITFAFHASFMIHYGMKIRQSAVTHTFTIPSAVRELIITSLCLLSINSVENVESSDFKFDFF